MNDSFLDEVENHTERLSNLGRPIEQFITTRKSRSTGAPIKTRDLGILEECQENVNINTNTSIAEDKRFKKRESNIDQNGKIAKQQDAKKQIEQERKIQITESKVLDKKVKLVETKVKSTDIARTKSEELQTRPPGLRNKVSDARQNSKEHRRSNPIPSSKTGDSSSKENNILSDNVTPLQTLSASRKIESKDSLALLNAIKDLISTYSKQESTKILRSMQDLHINSQANLIKHLLIQTEELTKEIHPSRDTSRLRKLVEENERMREDIIILKLRNDELQRKVDESILIKEENIALKLKIKELLKSGS